MRNLKWISPVFMLFLLLFSSCEEEKKNQMFMSVSGNPGELILVTTTAQWDGEIGNAFRDNFQTAVYGMPQEEPIFDLVQTNHSDFTRVFKTFRNVIIVELDTNRFGKADIQYRKDVFAKGQLVIKLKASSRDEVVDLITSNAKQMTRIVQTKELNRLGAKYRAHSNKEIQKTLLSDLGVQSAIPKEAVLAISDTNHAWVRIEREKLKGGYQHQISQGLLIFKYPYVAKQQFLDSELFKMRDAQLKKYIPGPSDGSYMTTEYR
ncbi:MAG: hypothetical protein ACI9GM_001548, partial [Salibacteraceae bacterium]